MTNYEVSLENKFNQVIANFFYLIKTLIYLNWSKCKLKTYIFMYDSTFVFIIDFI